MSLSKELISDKKTDSKVSFSICFCKEVDGPSGRASIGRHAMDRHTADTLAWRFAEFQAQKNRLKGRFQYQLQKEEDGTSGRT